MHSCATELDGLQLVTLKPLGDERGWFMRSYCHDELAELAPKPIVQINHSFTERRGTIRGLHFQHPPFSETKMVRCIRGGIYDVAVDIRKDSETFMRWFGVELTQKNNSMLIIPEGFAHGFQTLEPNCEILYLHTARYKPEAEGSISWNEPALRISWPLENPSLSKKDANHEPLPSNFVGISL
ncbi:dTDP-4-dehydrorhamnose 3,5-epimerase [Alteromonadaceae bacterium 2753L.S.0a.02]|nr:dTDP-4-dehydrorhamnose 3,5-epimerase [Alteromonadaceae bacterium 2753L.S.0a.02]